MTTPKRYEEMASELRGRRGEGPLGSLDSREVPALAEALRTAAREAQVRVLAEVLDVYSLFPNTTLYTALAELRARIENGEDL